jgi:hypothetical protein
MFVFETLMNIFEKVKFDLPWIGARFRAPVARLPRADDTSGNEPDCGDTR